ncbi:hypothetical protein EV580_1796 [Mycobacterium sp. BK086]|uniref:hypothetical protein n=1 Tax=Mycobacterium sp. BK086 TaxID=2512165 RepID=UPI0010E2C6F7|nr:hypothetical protein [Mycobacterium sp. BK086]TDO18609.1 hypothetical protein EV580_1796 [Mycobacterium sp. BK086]
MPNPVFIAPVIAQLVLNPVIYGIQLVTGHGADIPAEILDHINNLTNLVPALAADVIAGIGYQVQAPFLALELAINSVATATNKLVALLEAPAVFLDAALNSTYGLLGLYGPISLPILIRNALASAIAAPVPTIVLPFKKASGAAASKVSTPKAVTAPSGTAGSARSKPKATPTAASKRKPAASTKSSDNNAGQGRSKRG